MPEQKPISVTYLRANIYRLIDEIERTRKPLLILRKGKLLELRLLPKRKQKIMRKKSRSKTND